MNVVEIEGIGPERAGRLAQAGIVTTDDLLKQAGGPGGRRELAAATGFTTALILEWANRADLLRLDGVGSEYADLLEAAGVDSPVELAHRNPANLAAKLREISDAKPDIVRRVPGESQLADWITQAKSMPRMVWHGTEGPTTDAPSMTPPATERPTMAGEPSMAAEPGTVAAATSEPAPVMASAAAAPAERPMSASGTARETTPTMAPASQSAPAMAPRPTTPSAPPMPAPRPMVAPTHRREGLWFRIKRFLGLG
jgi:predicted flap endonuclease-1-like 5' DNA nuclease